MSRKRTHYDNLQVQENASPEVIHGAWVSLARKWDPDRHFEQREQAERVARMVDEAYRVLSDPALRREHDAWIRAHRGLDSKGLPRPVGRDSAVSTPATGSWGGRPSGPFRLTSIAVGWIALFALLWWVFDDHLDRREFPNRALMVTEAAPSEIALRRNRAGHYLVPGTINGKPVDFLVDTGATQVSVPAHLADHLELRPGARGRAMTANGTVTVRQTRIRELRLGSFLLQNVPGHINPGTESDQVLLGMSALRHLDFSQQGDTLTLRVP